MEAATEVMVEMLDGQMELATIGQVEELPDGNAPALARLPKMPLRRLMIDKMLHFVLANDRLKEGIPLRDDESTTIICKGRRIIIFEDGHWGFYPVIQN